MTLVGRTHADSVMAVVRSSALVSAIVAQLDVPLNVNADPNVPEGVQVVFDNVAVVAEAGGIGAVRAAAFLESERDDETRRRRRSPP